MESNGWFFLPTAPGHFKERLGFLDNVPGGAYISDEAGTNPRFQERSGVWAVVIPRFLFFAGHVPTSSLDSVSLVSGELRLLFRSS